MNTNELIKRWKAEEEIAHIHGWDFSHIEGRYMEEDDLPWNYREEILRYLKPEMRILDIDTGGGEFLLSPLRIWRFRPQPPNPPKTPPTGFR